MQKDNYDPYYNYRPHIVNQSPITQLMSYTWWHLENYYNNKGEFETAKYYTEQLCKILKLNNTTVLNKIKQDFLYQNLLTNK